MKKVGEITSLFGWRAWPALIDEDSGGCRTQRRFWKPDDMDILLATGAMRVRMFHRELKWGMSARLSSAGDLKTWHEVDNQRSK